MVHGRHLKVGREGAQNVLEILHFCSGSGGGDSLSDTTLFVKASSCLGATHNFEFLHVPDQGYWLSIYYCMSAFQNILTGT